VTVAPLSKRYQYRCDVIFDWPHRRAISADPDLQRAVAELGQDSATVRQPLIVLTQHIDNAGMERCGSLIQEDAIKEKVDLD
jgi:hypothetical protein